MQVDPDVVDDPGLRDELDHERALGHHRSLLTLVHREPDLILLVGLGGGCGALARYGVSTAGHGIAVEPFWSTLVVNLTGCLCLAVLMVALEARWPTTRWVRPLLGIGMLGGYTTYSTAMLDVRDLVADGRAGLAMGYLLLSVAGGLLVTALGLRAARTVIAPRLAVRP